MPQGSQPGERRGGRAPGTPNKHTAELIERLAELQCDPVEGLARIAADPTTDVALRARVYADLLPYLYPRRKAVAVSGRDGNDLLIRWAENPPVVQFVHTTEAEASMARELDRRKVVAGEQGSG